MSDRDLLEVLLVEVGAEVVFPETPAMVDDVLAGINRRRPVSNRPRQLRVAIVALVVILAAVLAMPGPRRAVAGLLGIGGVAITTVPELPPVAVASDFTGDPVSLDSAQTATGFTLLVPVGYGDPAGVYLDDEIPGGLATLAYQPGDDSYGLVITQMAGSLDTPLLEKVVGPDTTITTVRIGDGAGYWLEGEPHLVLVFDRDGRDYVDDPRLAGNTLLYVRDGITIRIESALDLEDAFTLASSLAPYDP